MSTKIAMFCVALVLSATGRSFAQSLDFTIPEKLSLSEALRIADERSPVLASARAEAAIIKPKILIVPATKEPMAETVRAAPALPLRAIL